MLEVFEMTVTLTVVEWVKDPEAPVTVKLNVDGIAEGPRLRFNVEVPGGVTEVEKRDAETPLGDADKLSVTGEVNPPSEFTVTEGEADPPTLMLTGEMALKEKSPTMSVKFCVAFGETPFDAVITIRYVPPVFAAGVPLSRPAEVNVTPLGSVPVSLNIAGGKPTPVTVKVPAVPTINGVLVALVMAGAWFTVNMKLCVVEPTLFVAVIVME